MQAYNKETAEAVKKLKYILLMLIVTAFLFDFTFRMNGGVDTVIVIMLQMAILIKIILSKAALIQHKALHAKDNGDFEALNVTSDKPFVSDESIVSDSRRASDDFKMLKRKIWSVDNALNGFQLAIGYIALLKLIAGLLLKQSPFEVPIQGMTLLFFAVAAFVILPLLLWVKHIERKRLRNQIQLVVFLLILFWMTMDGQGATLPTLGDIHLLNNLLAGVDYAVAVIICQYVQKFIKA
jgi:hypothetical protein